jgi:V/A-type H+-transporting ATPase subunit G/H
MRKAEVGKGGETMALEVIQEVTAMESQAKARREAAAARNKQQIADAQRQAKQTLEQARQQAEAKSKEMMAEAEEKAAQLSRQVMEQAEKDCEAQKQKARAKLDQAAQLIVEKVVNR